MREWGACCGENYDFTLDWCCPQCGMTAEEARMIAAEHIRDEIREGVRDGERRG